MKTQSFDALVEQHESALKAIGSPFGWGTLAIESAREELTRITSQRDQLLEALEAILANPDLSRNDWDKETMAVLTQARTAIAKAKGETL